MGLKFLAFMQANDLAAAVSWMIANDMISRLETKDYMSPSTIGSMNFSYLCQLPSPLSVTVVTRVGLVRTAHGVGLHHSQRIPSIGNPTF